MHSIAEAPAPTLEQIDALLTEHLFGWKWYQLTASGRDKAIRQDELDGEPGRRATILDGQRFLADPRYGSSFCDAGDWQEANMKATPAFGYETRVLPVSKNIGLAAVALQQCAYVTYKRREQWHEVRCAVDLPFIGGNMAPIAIVEAKEFAEAAARAVAQAYGLPPA